MKMKLRNRRRSVIDMFIPRTIPRVAYSCFRKKSLAERSSYYIINRRKVSRNNNSYSESMVEKACKVFLK